MKVFKASLTSSHIALIVANILFGMNFSLFRSIIESGVGFQQIFYSRVLFSGLVFVPFIFTRKMYKLDGEDLLRILFAMVLIIFSKQYMMLWGAEFTTPINASIIATLAPVTTLTFSMMIGGEKFHFIKIFGISLGVCAMLLLFFFDGTPAKNSIAFGNVLLFISTIAAATNTILIRPALRKLGVARTMGWYYIFGVIATTPFFYDEILTLPIKTLSTITLLELGWVVALGTILPNYLLYYATSRASSVHTASYYYLQPITATVFAIARGQTTIDSITLIAGAMISLSVLLVVIDHYRHIWSRTP